MAKKVGRPSSLDPAAVKKLENAFRVGASIKEAIGLAEVGRDAFERYCKKHPEFRGKIKQWQSQPTLNAKTVILRAIKNDNVNIAMRLLELEEKKATRREYGRRWRAEHQAGKTPESDQKTPSGFMQQFLTELNPEETEKTDGTNP